MKLNIDYLYYSVNAGCTALPILLNIKQVMAAQQVSNMWTNKEELPVSHLIRTLEMPVIVFLSFFRKG